MGVTIMDIYYCNDNRVQVVVPRQNQTNPCPSTASPPPHTKLPEVGKLANICDLIYLFVK